MPTPKKEQKKEHICMEHNFIVTSSIIRGGHKQAIELRCSHCLIVLDLEKLESKEWQAANL